MTATSIDNITYPESSTVTGGPLADITPSQRPGALKGAQILAQRLKLEGVDTVFGYPAARVREK